MPVLTADPLVDDRSDDGPEVELLINATWAVAARTGSIEPGVREILQEAGLSTKAFYRHFRSKDELLLVALDRASNVLVEYLEYRMARAPDPLAKITEWIDGCLRQAVNPSAARRILPWTLGFGRIASLFPEQLERNKDAIRALLAREIRAAVDCGLGQSPDPAGMFVADPTNPQSWNLYAYVMNNPLKYIDPTGMDVICNDDPDNFACTDDPTPPPVDENPGASPSATNSPNLGSWDSGGAFSGGFTLYATGYGGASQQPFAFSTSVAGASTNGGGRSSARGTQESKLRCTNRVANGFSIAGVIESAFDTEKHPYAAWTLDALAGNTFSGIGSIAEDFRTDPFKTYGDIIGGGLSQGLPGIGEALVKVGAPITLSKGLFGAATDIALASTPLGWGKFGFDALAYAGSALYCVTR